MNGRRMRTRLKSLSFLPRPIIAQAKYTKMEATCESNRHGVGRSSLQFYQSPLLSMKSTVVNLDNQYIISGRCGENPAIIDCDSGEAFNNFPTSHKLPSGYPAIQLSRMRRIITIVLTRLLGSSAITSARTTRNTGESI
jgi:hypothetical protein